MEKTPKYYALGMKFGLYNADDVQAWVNEKISETEKPDGQILELAYIKKNQKFELYQALLAIPDNTEPYEIVKALLSDINRESLDSIEFCRKLARNMYLWIDHDYEGPEDLKDIQYFDDAFDLAINELYGNLEDIHEEFKRFVSSFSKYG